MQLIKEEPLKSKRKRKLDPHIIRVDDAVKIITPKSFVRCGYPMCKTDTKLSIIEDYKEDIRSLIIKVYRDSTSTGNEFWTLENRGIDNKISIAFDKIVDEMAVIRMYGKKFGGNERKIYTKDEPDYEGQIGRVTSIRYVKTGVRVPSSGGGWGSEYDYEPPYLSNPNTHKILTLSFYRMDGAYEKDPPSLFGFWKDLEIEAIHVEKIM